MYADLVGRICVALLRNAERLAAGTVHVEEGAMQLALAVPVGEPRTFLMDSFFFKVVNLKPEQRVLQRSRHVPR